VSSPFVFAITLNWNRRDDTLECLESLTRLTYPNRRLLVVDNGSTDDSPQTIASRFPQVEQILNPANLGFAAGFNIGLRHALDAGADFAFIINNDTYVAPDSLEVLVKAAKPAEVGIVAPVIYYATAPERVWSSGGGRSLVTLDLTGNHGREQKLTTITEREFVSGCAMLIKREVLQRVGLFDEQFFMYYEDSDYCLRTRQAGFKLLVMSRARLWHKVSASSNGSDTPSERYWMGRSSSLFYRKHIRGWRWLILVPWRLGSIIKTLWRLWQTGSADSAWMYLHGVWHGLVLSEWRPR